MKKLILGISGGISFLLFLILAILAGYLGGVQETQNAAGRWDREGGTSQVSCFFSVNSAVSEDNIIEFEHSIDKALVEAAVESKSENPGARSWIGAYSADGQVSVSSDKTSVQTDAIGIGGDFFFFHPLKLLSGAYFSGNDLMQDYCIIDQDAAWKLFGSNDVAGMNVYINGIPHIVTGVVERETDKTSQAAGLDSTLIYVSYKTLSTLGSCNGINHYEVVMPNPVTGFAFNYVKENLAANEKETEVVENSTRYSLMSRLKMIPRLGYRSMNGKAIIYPYWENVARCFEDILAVMTIFEMLFLVYFVAVVIGFFLYWWKHKGWTIREKRLKLKDKAERWLERMRAARFEGRNRKSLRSKTQRKGQK